MITVIARTLNEENNVDRFCYCYRWADKILIADGGSKDYTKDRLFLYENVQVRDFTLKDDLGNGIFSNPRGKHINFLIDWAKDEQSDWIIFDDFDCVPTKHLQENYKTFLVDEWEMVNCYRMFILGTNKWFPEMNKPGQSLWAWKSDVDVRANEDSHTIDMRIPDVKTLYLDYPNSLLHYFYPDEATFIRKKTQYVRTGEVPEHYNPKEQFGRINGLPEWATWQI